MNLKNNKVVLDSSVIIEYLDEESPYKNKIEQLYNDILQKRIEAYIPMTTLSEIVYISSRIYQEANFKNPNENAIKFINWLLNYPNIKTAKITVEISLLAGEIRKIMKTSLIDCYVIATAKNMQAIPLFLKIEKEMEPYIDLLIKYGVQFIIK